MNRNDVVKGQNQIFRSRVTDSREVHPNLDQPAVGRDNGYIRTRDRDFFGDIRHLGLTELRHLQRKRYLGGFAPTSRNS
jgi:hypothetical protein